MTDKQMTERIAELERLVGAQRRDEFAESLLGDEAEDDTQRLQRLRAIRRNLTTNRATNPADAQITSRIKLVDQLILTNANTHEPEQQLAALKRERAYQEGQAARQWRADQAHLHMMPTREQHDQHVAHARDAIHQIDTQITQAQATIDALYGSTPARR
jgi:hypothetical protein